MKKVFTIACAGLLFASCTKDSPLTASLDKIHGDFKYIENGKDANVRSSLTKNDSTTIGGWSFDLGPIQDSSPNTTYFQFYVCNPPQDADNVTGEIDFTTDLSGLKLTDSVMDHGLVYYYIYTGTGKWRLMDEKGDLKNYFKITSSGELTYKYIKYTNDSDGIPYDNSQYYATLDGFGR